jgi:pimeloyl-ACP methyl ester carboxylesterase
MNDSNLYLHALSRDSLLTTVDAWKRVDLQLLQMLRSAMVHLEGRGLKTDPKVLLWGFSAAGEFVNRFAILHPDRVLAVAGGGIGWPIVPATEFEKESLRYPIGLADLAAFVGKPADLDAFRSVTWLLFRGAGDDNDPVRSLDCFAESDAELIGRRFGTTPVARWAAAERFYAEARLPARLVLYPGVGHSTTPAIREDIAVFFEKRLHEVYGTVEAAKP